LGEFFLAKISPNGKKSFKPRIFTQLLLLGKKHLSGKTLRIPDEARLVRFLLSRHWLKIRRDHGWCDADSPI
jgi:hypothetical protein